MRMKVKKLRQRAQDRREPRRQMDLKIKTKRLPRCQPQHQGEKEENRLGKENLMKR